MTNHLLWVVGAFIVALGLLIVVHELGHFAAARLCNVKILRFSLGFGRPLWLRRWGRDGTEWAVAAFPLGGYVKMLDEREAPVAAAELDRAFNRQSLVRRSFIVLAGPLANLLLAVILYWLLFMVGVAEPRPIFAAPPAGTLAAAAGVGVGETAQNVAGTPVATWSELRWEVLRHALDRRTVVLATRDAAGQLHEYPLALGSLDADALEQDILPTLGLILQRPDLPAVIGRVLEGSPAAQAGLQPGDRVLAIGGKPVGGWHDLALAIRNASAGELLVEFERGGRRDTLTVVPERVVERGASVARIGIAAGQTAELYGGAMTVVRYGPWAGLSRAVAQTWDTAVLSLRMIGRMVVGELSLKNVSGPVTIADYAGQSARLGGEHYLRFLALISISLGVLNLLPIPVLDGGHLMYYLIEFIKGGPLTERVMEIGQQIGLTLLALLMGLALYNDINRLISG